ncbi:ribonuclease H-like domain-containing protein [Candidatus Woesearchaeota archaeon]|nr:ribonuclease H-like domain-containing protein [Candidatus Woesearchaeota archaeon]
MLEESFIFLDGIGSVAEQRLWQQGISGWDSFLSSSRVKGMSSRRKIGYDLALQRFQAALDRQDTAFFSQALQRQQHWRLWEQVKHDAVFLDIETGPYRDVTVVGAYDGETTRSFVQGRNLERESLSRFLNQYSCIVTFNGSSFDLPVLGRAFNLSFPQVHIDLRHVCRKLGLTGGLKSIEQQRGIKRSTAGIDGADAPLLWEQWRAGSDEAGELLIRYNAEDCENLKPLAEYAIAELWKRTYAPVGCLTK